MKRPYDFLDFDAVPRINPRSQLPDSVSLSPDTSSSILQFGTVIGLEALILAYVDIRPKTFYLFVRHETLFHIKFLLAHELAFVYGPPGAGKSVVTWLYALLRAKRHDKRVIWQHRQKGEQITFMTSLITKTEVTRLKTGELPSADILILDGQSVLSDAAQAWLDANVERQAIFVSSEQFQHPPQGFETHEVMSWTKVEYQEALKHESIRAQVAANFDRTEDETEGKTEPPSTSANSISDEAFQAKYFLAGGSCRLMFHKTPAQVITFLETALRRVENPTAILSGKQGDRSAGAVNSLLQITKPSQQLFHEVVDDKSQIFVVSQFVMRQLGDKVNLEFVQMACSLKLNPSFDGWILELDFLLWTRRQDGLTLWDDEKPIFWPHLEKHTSFLEPEELSSLQESQWLIPKRWNQGGYDAVRVEMTQTDIKVAFVQVTCAQTHSFKARFMNQMTNHLDSLRGNKTLAVQFYFVVPQGDLESFTLPAYVDSKWSSKIAVLGFVRTRGTPQDA